MELIGVSDLHRHMTCRVAHGPLLLDFAAALNVTPPPSCHRSKELVWKEMHDPLDLGSSLTATSGQQAMQASKGHLGAGGKGRIKFSIYFWGQLNRCFLQTAWLKCYIYVIVAVGRCRVMIIITVKHRGT